MNSQSEAYKAGHAEKILRAVKLFNSDLSEKELSSLYAKRLKQLDYSEEEATYWKDFYFGRVTQS